jgi:hypothetical protein
MWSLAPLSGIQPDLVSINSRGDQATGDQKEDQPRGKNAASDCSYNHGGPNHVGIKFDSCVQIHLARF